MTYWGAYTAASPLASLQPSVQPSAQRLQEQARLGALEAGRRLSSAPQQEVGFAMNDGDICRRFARGKCRSGSKCRFSHDVPGADTTAPTARPCGGSSSSFAETLMNGGSSSSFAGTLMNSPPQRQERQQRQQIVYVAVPVVIDQENAQQGLGVQNMNNVFLTPPKESWNAAGDAGLPSLFGHRNAIGEHVLASKATADSHFLDESLGEGLCDAPPPLPLKNGSEMKGSEKKGSEMKGNDMMGMMGGEMMDEFAAVLDKLAEESDLSRALDAVSPSPFAVVTPSPIYSRTFDPIQSFFDSAPTLQSLPMSDFLKPTPLGSA